MNSIKISFWEKEKSWWTEKEHNEYQTILDLLSSIRQKWNIPFEVVSDYDEKDVYNEIFLKNRNMLRKRTGRNITDLKSRSGNVFIGGVVAIFSNSGDIIYYDQSTERDLLLKKILEEGPLYVKRIVDQNVIQASRNSPEDKLINDFVANAKEYGFTGEIFREYSLKRPIEIDPKKDKNLQEFQKSFSYLAGKSIDMLHIAQDGTYDVIEAKVKLNWAAVGQAIGYKKLFCMLSSIAEEKVRTVILCRQTDGFIEFVCDSLEIKVITHA